MITACLADTRLLALRALDRQTATGVPPRTQNPAREFRLTEEPTL
jgi:hypothetical protein